MRATEKSTENVTSQHQGFDQNKRYIMLVELIYVDFKLKFVILFVFITRREFQSCHNLQNLLLPLHYLLWGFKLQFWNLQVKTEPSTRFLGQSWLPKKAQFQIMWCANLSGTGARCRRGLKNREALVIGTAARILSSVMKVECQPKSLAGMKYQYSMQGIS